ncbi:copper chaperone PCu(A)C [Hydrogenophaga aquatica]
MKKLIAAAMLAVTASAWAQSNVKVEDAWVRGTVAQQKSTGAFMRLTAQKDARLVSASSPVAGVTEVHEMAMDKDVMRMRAVEALPLPAGKTVELKPGGYHVMLLDLKGPVKAGETVPLTLVFEDAQAKRETLELQLPVRALGAAAATPAEGMQHQHGHKH